MTTGPNDDLQTDEAPITGEHIAGEKTSAPNTLEMARDLLGEDAAPEDMGALLVAKLQAALAEIETLKDAGLRALAEGENIRRRAERAPECVASWGRQAHGLVLMTGPTGSGKSSLLAALLHDINQHCEGHLLTLEDPIEYQHVPLQCLVHQREVGRDTPDFESGLRAALREDPDVILVGEMRDAATIRLALTAAETGHLVLSTLHTASAPQAVDRLVDAFSSHEKEAVRALFAENLIAVLAQTLCPKLGGVGRVAAHEIMIGTPAVRHLIREGKLGQLYSAIQTGQAVGMQTLDQSLLRHFQSGQISAATLRLLSKFNPKSQSDGQSLA